jgi:hypothetical protein
LASFCGGKTEFKPIVMLSAALGAIWVPHIVVPYAHLISWLLGGLGSLVLSGYSLFILYHGLIQVLAIKESIAKKIIIVFAVIIAMVTIISIGIGLINNPSMFQLFARRQDSGIADAAEKYERAIKEQQALVDSSSKTSSESTEEQSPMPEQVSQSLSDANRAVEISEEYQKAVEAGDQKKVEALSKEMEEIKTKMQEMNQVSK